MALQIPTGFAQCTFILQATGDPDPWNVTLGLDVSGVGGDYVAAANQALLAWETWVLPGQSSIVRFVGVRLQVGQDGGDPVIVDVTSGSVGGISADFLPQNTALLVRKNTGVGGRRNRGRMFVPLILESAQVDNVGVISGVTVSGLQAQFDSFLIELDVPTDPGAPSIPPVVLHNPGVGPALDPTPVSSLAVQSVIATQRRRLR